MSTAEILSPEAQRKRIRKTDSMGAYLHLLSVHFREDDNGEYVDEVRRAVPDTYFEYMSPDYWRFSALFALQTAEAGYPAMLGHTIEHRNRQLKHHAFSPRGLLQTLQRIADINKRSYVLRETIEAQVSGKTNSLVFNPKAIWGIAAKEVGGRRHLDEMKPLEVMMYMSARTNSERPICLPDIQLIEQLAGLELDHDLDDTEFLKTDYPKVAEIIGDLMDPAKVFVTPAYRRRFGLFPEPTQLHLRPYELPEILSQKDGAPRELKVIEKFPF